MIDINFITKNKASFEDKMKSRGKTIVSIDEYNRKILKTSSIKFNVEGVRGDVFCTDYIVQLVNFKKDILQELERKRHEINILSDQIAKLKQSNAGSEEISKIKDKSIEISRLIPDLESCLNFLNKELKEELDRIPNLIDDSIPFGLGEEDNKEMYKVGERPTFDFEPREHQDICQDLGGINFEVSTKVSTTRTNFMFTDIARLHRALTSFMMDIHTREGKFDEVSFPILVRPTSLYGTGQLSTFNFHNDLFHIQHTHHEDHHDTHNTLGQDESSNHAEIDDLDMIRDLFLIPTGEVPMVNALSNCIINEEELPIRLVGYSECFRKEAGAGGKDLKGIIRQKQFGKVELVSICSASQSNDEHENILQSAERILKLLGLHYRVVLLCSGDIGFASQRTYDIEVWLPGQQKYREISSCSNIGSFQSRRAKIRVRSGKRKEYAHTLNGSGLAVGRTLIAIVENYQNKDGSITIPEALRPYMNGQEVIDKSSKPSFFSYLKESL